MKKIWLLIVIGLSFFGSSVYGKSEMHPWEEKACTDLYNSIGFFTHLSDIEWKANNEKKAAFYASVAADYAVIYQTVCNEE